MHEIPDHVRDPRPERYLEGKYITIDFETTNLDKGWAGNENNNLILVSWKQQGSSTQFLDIDNNPEQIHKFLDAIRESNFIVAHHGKFELQWLQRLGYPIEKLLLYDTLLGEYVLAGNRRIPLSLGESTKRYGLGEKDPFVDICMKAGICPSQMPRSMLIRRVMKDVEQTEALFIQQREILQESDRLRTLYTRCLLTPVLADIEFNGMYLDVERVKDSYRKYLREANQLKQEIDELTGGINLNSPKQLGEYIYTVLGESVPKNSRGEDRTTPSGNYPTDSGTLSSLRYRTSTGKHFAGLYKQYNKLVSALSKNLEFFIGAVEDNNGYFYGQFNQSVTQTHRLSSSGRGRLFQRFKKSKSVQFQNLPREFKRLFTARHPGWLFSEGDGAQLEFRVAGHLGKDSTAIDAIRNGFDVHSFTASVLTEHGEETSRQDAKPHTFKPLYGGRSGTKAQQEYYKAFRERYSGITETQNKWIARVVATKELRIPSGLIFYWPEARMSEDGYVNVTPSVCNYPVQSYATADIIPIGLVKLWHELKAREMESFIINTVHDSVEAELHPDEVDLYKEIFFEAFTDYVYFYLDKVYDDQFIVPLGAEIKIGTHWGEGEEEKRNIEPPYQEAA